MAENQKPGYPHKKTAPENSAAVFLLLFSQRDEPKNPSPVGVERRNFQLTMEYFENSKMQKNNKINYYYFFNGCFETGPWWEKGFKKG